MISQICLILKKLQKENKSLLIMGDFNINLVNYDSHPETNDFINLMVSHYLLPHILHPARVTDHSATIIDNIFFNTLELNTQSGNLLNMISDHFPQFLVVKMLQLITRIVLYFSMTTQNLVNIYFWMISRNSLGKILLTIRIQTSMSNLTDFMRTFTLANYENLSRCYS